SGLAFRGNQALPVLNIEDPQNQPSRAKPRPSARDLSVLGANVARQCLEAGLLDEILVHIAPVLLGDGVRLFERPAGTPVQLDPVSSETEGETTVLRYAPPGRH